MHLILPIVLTFLAGIGVAAQAPTNGMLAKVSGSTLLAALISFGVGTVAIAIAWAASDRTSPAILRDAPAWAWLGGIYGAIYVATAAYAAPRLGVATMLMVAIAGQLAAAIVIDHFGLFGIRAEPVSVSRIAGLLLVIAGVTLVRR
ncbi:DMT family transporter [uncultured Sphingomonas sp.]|uniref:DMT family transporter n=1 Tax=uncultured Sphingomonas sp. TaxID=158754 RepID=UPI00374921D3